MSVREAGVLDVLPALALAEKYFQEAGDHLNTPYNLDLAAGRLLQAIDDPDQILLVYLSDGVVRGVLWGAYGPFIPWSLSCITHDIVVYVEPDCRGGLGGVRLIQKFQVWSESKGASECRLSIASGINEDKTGAMYQRMQYQHLGSQYRRKLNVTNT